MSAMSPGSPIVKTLLLNVTADETISGWVNVCGYPYLAFYCSSVGTTSSGVVTFEESAPADTTAGNASPFSATTGSQSAITTVNASTFSGDASVAVHAPVASYGWVRARVSTVIGGGGTISVTMVAG